MERTSQHAWLEMACYTLQTLYAQQPSCELYARMVQIQDELNTLEVTQIAAIAADRIASA